MSPTPGHRYRNVVLAGGYNTIQARHLPEHDSLSICMDAALGVLGQAGLSPTDVDAVYGTHAQDLIFALDMRNARGTTVNDRGSTVFLDAINAVAAGASDVVLIAGGGAGVYTERAATAPWTRPSNEFVAPFGLYTAVQFALIARRHFHLYGTTPHHLASVAALIRNNGHVNPQAVYFGRGPFTAEDELASRMVAEPFHLLDCAMTAEGGAAMLITSRNRLADLPSPPVYVLGIGQDHRGPLYQKPPAFDMGASAHGTDHLGMVGARAARQAFAMAGLSPSDVGVCELYDAFSFEVIRQLEAFGFCGVGEGGDYVLSGAVSPGGANPVTTDGGLLSFSHSGWAQQIQRLIRAVHQLQGRCASHQVNGVEAALCSIGGAGAMYTDVILLGSQRP